MCLHAGLQLWGQWAGWQWVSSPSASAPSAPYRSGGLHTSQLVAACG